MHYDTWTVLEGRLREYNCDQIILPTNAVRAKSGRHFFRCVRSCLWYNAIPVGEADRLRIISPFVHRNDAHNHLVIELPLLYMASYSAFHRSSPFLKKP